MDYSKLNNIAASIQDVENAANIVENRLTNLDKKTDELNESVIKLDNKNNLIINPKSEVESTATDSLIGGVATVGKGAYAFGFGGNAQKVYISGNASDGYQLQVNVTSSFDPTNWIRPLFESIYKNTYLLDANTYEKVAKITAVTPNNDNLKISITLDTDLGTLTNVLYRLENISKNKSLNFGVFGNIGDWSSILGYCSYNIGNYSNLIGSNNYNSKTYSTLIGTQNANTGNYSTLIGYNNKATAGNYPCAIGVENILNAYGYAIGRKNVINGNGYSIGFDNLINTNGTATVFLFGQELVCENNKGGFFIGQYNKEYISNNPSIANWFAVGCGDPNSPRQNAIEVKQNLDTYVYGVGGFIGDNSDNASIKPLHTVINGLETKSTNNNTAINTLQSTISNLNDKVDNNELVVSSSLNDLSEKVDELTDEVNDNERVVSTSLNDLSDRVDINESTINDHFTDNNSIKVGTAINVSGIDSIAGGAGVSLTGNRAFGYGMSMSAIYLTGDEGTYSARLYSTSNYTNQNNIADAFATTHLNSYLLKTSDFSRVAKITNIVYNGVDQPLTITLDTDLGELTNAVYAIENVAGTKSFNSGSFGNTGQNSSVIGFNNFNKGNYSSILGSINNNNGTYSTVLGYLGKNTGNYSSVIGSRNNNAAIYSNVIGLMNTNDSTATYSNIIGRNNTNKCSSTSIIGVSNTVNETTYPSVITGYENIADVATQQFTLGYGNHGTRGQYAEGNASASWMIGHHLTTSSGCWALGKYNKDYDVQEIAKQNFFVVGQGNTNRPLNNLEVKNNGNWYVYGVGGFDGTNSDNANVKTLQDVISNILNNSSSSSSSSEYISYHAGQGYSIGSTTTASGEHSFAEGLSTNATGNASHAEGSRTRAYGSHSHAEGDSTIANNEAEHAEGKCNVSHSGTISSIGIGTSSSDRKNAFEVLGNGNIYVKGLGNYDGTSIANIDSLLDVITDIDTRLTNIPVKRNDGGYGVEIYTRKLFKNTALDSESIAAGMKSVSVKSGCTTFGAHTYAIGVASLAQGCSSVALGAYSHAEGCSTNGTRSLSSDTNYAENNGDSLYSVTLAKNYSSGSRYIYTDEAVDAGYLLTKLNVGGSYDGDDIRLLEDFSYDDYDGLKRTRLVRSCEWDSTNNAFKLDIGEDGFDVSISKPHTLHFIGGAFGAASHSEGYRTAAYGEFSHSQGEGTIAFGNNSCVVGQYNFASSDDLFAVGNGTGNWNNRSNALVVKSNGNVYIKGIGTYDGTNIGQNGVKSVQQVIADLTQQISKLSNN